MLGTLDSFLLWTNLGISLLVLVAASYFGLSLKQALLATLVGGVLGNAMLGVAALIGADARVPTMALQRAPLGQRGSYIATALNVLQCLGWSVFEITIIAFAAGALSQRLFGVHLVWMWKLVFGALGLVLALLGPVGFVRRFVRKFGIWAVAASIVYLAVWILAPRPRRHALARSGGHGGSFWLGVDLVIALTVSWVPLVADYTRFSRTRRAAFLGAGLGYLLPTLFQFGFGAMLVLSHPVDRRADGRADDGRGGRRRLGARAARADRRRDRRGVREHLLDRGLAAELRAARVAAAADRRRRGARDGDLARRSTSRSTSSSCCCSARSSCRSSACCSPTGSSRGRHYTRAHIFDGPRVAARDDRRLARRLRALRVDRADAGTRLLDALARAPPPARAAGSAPRCRASRLVRPRARRLGGAGATAVARPGVDFAAVRPLAVIGHLSRDVVAGARAAHRRRAVVRRRARCTRSGRRRCIFAKCGEDDRARFQRRARRRSGCPRRSQRAARRRASRSPTTPTASAR